MIGRNKSKDSKLKIRSSTPFRLSSDPIAKKSVILSRFWAKDLPEMLVPFRYSQGSPAKMREAKR
jgi:hypothetical protein